MTSLSAQENNASSYIAWRPPCETLPTDAGYLYKGPHELDSYSLCLVGHASSSTPASPIASPPRCLFVRVLRCTQAHFLQSLKVLSPVPASIKCIRALTFQSFSFWGAWALHAAPTQLAPGCRAPGCAENSPTSRPHFSLSIPPYYNL